MLFNHINSFRELKMWGQKVFLALVFLCCAVALSAQTESQTVNLNGKVKVLGSSLGVAYAEVLLITAKDSLHTMTFDNGSFSLKKIPLGSAIIEVRHPSYSTFITEFKITKDTRELLIELCPETLDAAIIRGDIPLTSRKKDTLIFNAAAVKTMEGDNARAIMEFMPGVKLGDSSISIDGRRVSKTYVNGRLVFGKSVIAPLDHLLAEEVKSIACYEEINELDKKRDIHNARKELVLDIRTHKPLVSYSDAYAIAGVGAENQARYLSKVNANFFSEDFLSYASIDADNLSLNDINFNTLNNAFGPLTTSNNHASFKTGIEKNWGDDISRSGIALSYQYYQNDYDFRNFSQTDYLQTSLTPAREAKDSTLSNSQDKNHYLNFSYHNPDLNILVNLSYSDDFSSKDQISSLKWDDSYSCQKLRTSENTSKWIGYAYLSYRKNLEAIDSYLNTSAWISLNQNTSLGLLNESDTEMSSEKNQKSEGDIFSLDSNISASLSKNLINDKDLYLSVSPLIEFSFNQGKSNYNVFNIISEDVKEIDVINSHDYIQTISTLKAGLNNSLNIKDIRCNLSILYVGDLLDDKESFPFEEHFQYKFHSPDINLSVNRKSFSYSLSSKALLPSMTQLRNRLDDRNPRYLIAGNNNLKASQQYSQIISYVWSKNNGRLNLNLGANYTANPIVGKSVFYQYSEILPEWHDYTIQAGSSLSTYENAPYLFGVSISSAYSNYLYHNQIQYNIGLVANYSKAPRYINSNLIYLNESSPSLTLGLQYRKRKKGNLNLNNVTNYKISINSEGSKVASLLHNTLSLNASYNIDKIGWFKLKYSWDMNRNPDYSDFNSDIHVLNVAYYKYFLKGRLGLGVSLNDLLNKGSLYEYSTAADYKTKSYAPSYGRYFIVTLAYKFNKANPKAKYNGSLKN